MKSYFLSGERNRAVGNEFCFRLSQRHGCGISVSNLEFGLPMHQIIRAFVLGKRPSVVRTQVLEQLNSRAPFSPQRCDPQSRSENIIQMLLLSSIILTLARDLEAQQIAIELQTRVGIRDHDSGVVDAKKQPVTWPMPFWIPFAFRKLQDF